MSNYNDNLSEKYLEIAKEIEIFFKKYNKYYDSSEYLVKLIENYKNQIIYHYTYGKKRNEEEVLDNLLEIIKKENPEDPKFLNSISPLPKIKRFFSEEIYLKRLDDEIKNLDDAKYIHRMLLISQKMNFKDKDIDELKKTDFLEKLLNSYGSFLRKLYLFTENSKQTDFLKKLIDTYKDFERNPNLSNLREFIENSVNPTLTIRALINYYEDMKIGYEYIKDFSHNSINDNYLDPIDFRDQINASVNILTNSGKASGVVYQINTQDNEVIIITNAHVIDDANEINVQFVNDIETKNAHYFSFKDKKEIDIGIIVLKMEEDEINKLKEPKINIDSTKYSTKLLEFGNSMGFGLTDKSTNMTQGKILEINDNEIAMRVPSFSGNSGCGIFNEKGELIGIDYAGEKQILEALEEKNPDKNNIAYRKFNEDEYDYAFGIPIKAAIEAADELISEYNNKKRYEEENNNPTKSLDAKSINPLGDKINSK